MIVFKTNIKEFTMCKCNNKNCNCGQCQNCSCPKPCDKCSGSKAHSKEHATIKPQHAAGKEHNAAQGKEYKKTEGK